MTREEREFRDLLKHNARVCGISHVVDMSYAIEMFQISTGIKPNPLELKDDKKKSNT